MTRPCLCPRALLVAAALLATGCRRAPAGAGGGTAAPLAASTPRPPDPSPWRVAFEGACALGGVSAIEGATFVHLSPPEERHCRADEGRRVQTKSVPSEDHVALRWGPEGGVDRASSRFASGAFGRWPHEAFLLFREGGDDGTSYTRDLVRWRGDRYQSPLRFNRYNRYDVASFAKGGDAVDRGHRVFQEEPFDVLAWGEGRWVAAVRADGYHVPFEPLSFRMLAGAGPAPTLRGLPMAGRDYVEVASRAGREIVALVHPPGDVEPDRAPPPLLVRWAGRGRRVERLGPAADDGPAGLVKAPSGAVYLRGGAGDGAGRDVLREVLDGGLGPPLDLPPAAGEVHVGADGTFWALTEGERVWRFSPGASAWQDTLAPEGEELCAPKALDLVQRSAPPRLVPVAGATWFLARGGEAFVLRDGGAWARAAAPRAAGIAVCITGLRGGHGAEVWAAAIERYDEPPCRWDEPGPVAWASNARRFVLTTAPVAATLRCDGPALVDYARARGPADEDETLAPAAGSDKKR